MESRAAISCRFRKRLLARAFEHLFAPLVSVWRQKTAAKPRAVRAQRSQSAALRPMVFDTLEPRLLLNGDVFQAGQALSLVDADGTQVIFELTGAGVGAVASTDQGFDVVVSGSDVNTAVSVTTSGGDGRSKLHALDVAGSMQGFSGATLDVTGNIAVSGTLAQLTLGNIAAAQEIAVSGTGVALQFSAGEVVDLSLDAGSAIGSVSVQSWQDLDTIRDVIRAPSIGMLKSAGDFNASLELTGQGVTGFVLTSAQIGGAITGGLWNVQGRAFQVLAQSIASAWQGSFTGALQSLTTTGDLSGVIATPAIQIITVGGDLEDARIFAGANLGTDGRFGGSGAAADTFVKGTLARLRVTGSIIASEIYIGVDPKNGTFNDGDDQFAPGSGMQELIVGQTIDGESFIVSPLFPPTVRVNGVSAPASAFPGLESETQDFVAPTLNAVLANDTGAFDDDRLTRDASVEGQVVDLGTISALFARFDDAADFIDVTQHLQPDKGFTLDKAALNAIAGGTLADGAHVLTIEAVDGGGNRGRTELSFTLDTTAPDAPVVALDAASDSGAFDDDRITNDNTPTLNLAGEAGSTLALFRDGLATGEILAGPSGQITLGPLADGTYAFSAHATDLAGNTGGVSQALLVTIDTLAPQPPVVALDAASDSGAFDDDRITNDSTPTMTLAGEAGSTLALLRDGIATGESTTGPSGQITLAPLADNTYAFSARATDAAGNTGTVSAAVLVTIDTQAPAQPRLDLAPAFDTDPVGDQQTTLAAVTLEGTTEAQARVLLVQTAAETTADASGAFQFTGIALALGSNAFTVRATDRAGNASEFSRTITRLELPPEGDTEAPVIQAALANDTGRGAADSVSQDPTVRGTVTDASAIVAFRAGLDATAPANFADVLGKLQNGSFTLSPADLAAIAGAPLTQGPHTLHLIASDSEGNTSNVFDFAFLFDTIAPTVSAPDLLAASDSGADDTDDLTRDATPTIRVVAEDGALVFLFVDGNEAAQGVASGGFIDFTLGPLADRAYLLTAVAEDLAGNPKDAFGAPTITIDTQPPAQPAFDLTEASDTAPIGDHSTTESTVTLAGTTSAQARVVLTATGAETTADGSGAFAFAGIDLTLGANPFTVRAIDMAGNQSEFSRTITRTPAPGGDDTDAPIVTAALVNDSGQSANDGVTNDARVSGTIADASAIASFKAGFDALPESSFLEVVVVVRADGTFSLSAGDMVAIFGGTLTEGAHTLHLIATDAAGNRSQAFDLEFTIDTLSPTVAAPDLLAASDSGSSPLDDVTNDATPTVRVLAEPESLVRIRVDGIERAQGVASGGAIEFVLPALADGIHGISVTAEDAAGNLSLLPQSLSVTIDTSAPTLEIDAPTDGGDVVPGARLAGTGNGTGSSLEQLSYQFDALDLHALPFEPNGAFDRMLSLVGIGAGPHSITVSAIDRAGNAAATSLDVNVTGLPFVLTGHTPVEDAEGVVVGLRPRIDFSEAVNAATVTGASFFATVGGHAVAANVVVDASGLFARLFFDDPLPGGAQVRVTIDGSAIRSQANNAALDADEDGTAGGTLTFAFTTVSLSALPGTTLVGRLADAGPDLLPLTADDTLPGPDGALGTPDDIVLLPVVGAHVLVRGLESRFVSTGADGHFFFDAVPAGTVALAMQGEHAAAPAGFTFPELNADLDITAGAANSIGTIYMPRLAAAAVQTVNTGGTTVLTLPPEAAGGLTDEQRQLFTLEIAPGGLLGPNGLPVASAQVLMSVVPTRTLMPFLPPTLPAPLLAFTTQLRGATDVGSPFRMTMPNLSGAPVGTEFQVLSFDPATGKLVNDSTAVVVSSSAFQRGLAALDGPELDGDMVVWDPGEEGGVVACFHVVLPKPSSVEEPECEPGETPTKFVFPVFIDNETFRDYFFTSDGDGFVLHFENAAEPPSPTDDACDVSPLKVEIKIEQPSSRRFIDRLQDQTFYLHPQEQKDIHAFMRRLLEGPDVDAATANELLGATISLKGTVVVPQSGAEIVVFEQKIYVYRLFDIADSSHIDGLIEFEKTLADGGGAATGTAFRNKPLELVMPDSAKVSIVASGVGFKYEDASGSLPGVTYDPEQAGGHFGKLTISSDNGPVGSIDLKGIAIPKTQVVFPRGEFEVSIAAVVDSSDQFGSEWTVFRSLFPADSNDNDLLSDEPGYQAVVDMLYNGIVNVVEGIGYNFDPLVAAAIDVVDSGSGVKINPYVSLDGQNEYTPGEAVGSTFWVDFNRPGFNDMAASRKSMSLAQEQFLLSTFVNLSPTDPSPKGFQGVALKMINLTKNLSGGAENFINLTADTLTHEVGHILGAIHSRDATNKYIKTDVMGPALYVPLTFGPNFRAIVKMALGIPVADFEYTNTLEYYRAMVNREDYGFSIPNHAIDHAPAEAPLLFVYDGPVAIDQPAPNLVASADLGVAAADGAGGQSNTLTLFLVNEGDQELSITDVALIGANAGFSIEGIGPLPLALPAMDPHNLQPQLSTRAITLRFDPSAVGAAEAVLRITSNQLAGVVVEIPVSAIGISPAGDIALTTPNTNNFGGVRVGDPAASITNVGAIANRGASALTITGIALEGEDGQFALTGVPPGLGQSSPLILDPGESFTFGATFDAARAGLHRALVEITSDDPDQPVVRYSLVGTGLPDAGTALDYGRDYVAVEAFAEPSIPVQRQISDASGRWSFFFSPDLGLHNAIFDPASGLITHAFGTTSAEGETELGMPEFLASTAVDSDHDGLPDDIEFAIGSSAGAIDTDADGVDDFAEIAAGGNPLDGVAGRSGILGALGLDGTAWDVAFDGTTAYVAMDDAGLAIVDVSDPLQPILVGSVDLLGVSQTVAVDGTRALAVLGAQFTDPGVRIVDVSDPTAPQLVRTISFPAGVSHVEALDGVAYAASGAAILAIELASGDVLQSLNLGGTVLTGLAREGELLFAMDSVGKLSAIDISEFQMIVRDSLTVAHGGGQVFVVGGIAYLANRTGFFGGFATVDVSNPNDLVLISNSDAGQIRPDAALAADGSGGVLIVGNAPDPQQPGASIDVVDVADASDPTNTGAYLNRFPLTDFPLGVAIASGLGLIAGGDAGLLVVAYRSDAAGVAPSVVLSTLADDVDPVANGIQVAAGSLIHLLVDATDDVLVKNVELLVNGVSVAADLSFPYEALLAAAKTGALSLQARATDIGGNVALSNALVIDVVPDTFAPDILAIDPPDDASRPEGLQEVTVRFDEALAPETVTAGNFRVSAVGGQPIAADVVLRSEGRVVELSFVGLDAGNYQIVIAGTNVTDIAGNALAAADVVSTFTLTGDAIEWINPDGGFWDVASNWEGGILPGVDDNVLIDVDGADVTIIHRSGTTLVNRVISRENLIVTGGTLDVTTTLLVDRAFEIGNGATLKNATILEGQGVVPTVTSFATFDGVSLADDLAVAALATLQVRNGLDLQDVQLGLFAGADLSFSGAQTLGGSGSVFFGTAGADSRITMSGGLLTIGENITIHGNKGSLSAFSDGLLRLEGTVLADVAGQTIIVEGSGAWTNAGRLVGGAGVLELGGTFTIEGRGIFDANKGQVALVGILDNTGKTLTLDTATGSLTLDGGRIRGGRLEFGDGVRLGLEASGTLEGVTLGSDLAIVGARELLVVGGLTLDDATIELIDDNGGLLLDPDLTFQGTQALQGTGRILFTGPGDDGVLRVTNSSATLTIGPGITINSTAPSLGLNGRFINQGVIAFETNTTSAIFVTTSSFVNEGTLRLLNGADMTIQNLTNAGGTITLGAGSTMSGVVSTQTVVQTGGVIDLQGGTINVGTLDIQGGTLMGAGSIDANVINAGRIEPGSATGDPTGTISITNGNFAQTATGVLSIQLGGAAVADYDRLLVALIGAPLGTAMLGGTLEVNLVGGFTPALGDVFAILTCESLTAGSAFATITGLDLGGGLSLQPLIESNGVRLQVVSTAAPTLLSEPTIDLGAGASDGSIPNDWQQAWVSDFVNGTEYSAAQPLIVTVP